MGKKILAALVVGGLLVGAGFLYSVISSPDMALAQEDEGSEGTFSRIIGFLDEVIDDLVDDDTITQDQADAIVSAIEEKAAAVKEDLEANRELLREMLEDGVITEEEASDLPDDHFLFDERFDEAWEDGELSADDLRGLFRHGRRGFFPHRFGTEFPRFGNDTDA